MVQERPVQRILKGTPTLEGAGVHLRRVFGHAELPLFDPFLMLDDFRSNTPEHYRPGFPWHPHRGIETITYVLRGDVAHGDSLGNKGVISSGDVQWMTAGSGIIHQEMPQGDADGAMHGFQLWANLPAGRKMMAPRYNGIPAKMIPETVLEDGVRMRIIAGTMGSVRGPMADIVIDPEFLDCTVPGGSAYRHRTEPDYTALIYVIGGSGRTGGTDIQDGTLVHFGPGSSFFVEAGKDGIRFLILTGRPLGEPIAWGGPIVMNTQEELDTAFAEYRQGTFIKDT